MPFDEAFLLTLWTADPALAAAADAAGIDRIGVDLESLGKKVRQGSRDTWLSPHREADLDVIRPALSHARLFARVNPLNPETGNEVGAALARGVQVLMFPMVMNAADAKELVRAVAQKEKPT